MLSVERLDGVVAHDGVPHGGEQVDLSRLESE
jgi:hypothetical protein